MKQLVTVVVEFVVADDASPEDEADRLNALIAAHAPSFKWQPNRDRDAPVYRRWLDRVEVDVLD